MSLTYRINKTTDLGSYPGEIPTRYLYTYGLAGEEFFRAIMEKGKFLASHCDKCGVTQFPARAFCERCLAPTPETIEVPGTGEIFAFTICHRNMDGSEKEKPDLIALIKIDQTDGFLIHYLEGVDQDEINIGMQVTPVLKQKKERKGGIFDITHFKPVQ